MLANKYFFFIISVVTSTLAVCDPPDDTAANCETSDASPLVSDCQIAIQNLGADNQCLNTNGFGSECTTVTTHGTCKIDACSIGNTFGLQKGVDCGGYLQTILNQCNSNGRVGGTLFPMLCNQAQGFDVSYKVQFSHA
ncbi:hypothetical protein CCMSSC00406_0005139 [Pleurotus cornucopiae]|uniref:Uncharacterized protein n=1 Tax=Pleurotus cornucopiae TaxID=5321 RepID=A0ACB7JA12_PLECO|nr:hypothetical protein CCMSSC00406_0005139 [Pleurotus cornucopiae]